VPEIEVKRHLGRSELAEVTQLVDAASEADGHPALGEHAWLDLVQGGRQGFAGLVAWEPGHAHPVGYAQLNRGTDDDGEGQAGDHGEGHHDSWALEVIVDPHHRTAGNPVAAELVRSAVDLIGAQGGGHLHLWVSQPAPHHYRLAEAVGLSPGRSLYQMRRPLPGPERATITTRPFRPGPDDEAWLEVNNRAFEWHPEQGGWTLETFRARQAQPWFDPQGFLLHEQDGRLAGFCWTKVHGAHDHDDSGPLGEIYVVAVDPDFAGRSLGRQLTLAGLGYLADKGLDQAMLYVDAGNARAVGLYVALGFTVNHIDRAFTGDIPALRS
jgi:mycothiol synthase